MYSSGDADSSFGVLSDDEEAVIEEGAVAGETKLTPSEMEELEQAFSSALVSGADLAREMDKFLNEQLEAVSQHLINYFNLL